MAFGSFNESGGGQPMAEINTTPLVDVMLVLLVIFIITAPLFQQAVPIDLPKVSATKVDDQPETIHLAVDGAGGLCTGTARPFLGKPWKPASPKPARANPSCTCGPTAACATKRWPT